MTDKGYSTYDVAKLTGGKITHAAVWGIVNEQSKDVKVSTLMALAKALEVSEFHLFSLAIGRPPNPAEQMTEEHRAIIEDYDDIPSMCQKDVRDLLKVLRGNHSISARRARGRERPDIAAKAGDNPRQGTPTRGGAVVGTLKNPPRPGNEEEDAA